MLEQLKGGRNMTLTSLIVNITRYIGLIKHGFRDLAARLVGLNS